MALRIALAASGVAAATSMDSYQFMLQRRVVDGSHRSANRHRALQDEAPIYGDFKKLAYFYADVYIGTPPQKFTVITDTGSSLTAVPCSDCTNCGTHMNPKYDPSKSTSGHAVGCNECPGGSSCVALRCRYTQSYAEGSSLVGNMYKDSVYLGSDGDVGSVEQSGYAIPFNFGCGTSEGGLFTSQEADGIMGLGQGDLSITKALWLSQKLQRNMFSLCLSFDGGALTMGAVDPRLHGGPVTWARMELTGFYVVKVEGFDLEGTDCNFGDFNAPHTILDSGTTFTYIPSVAFQRLKDSIDSWCKGAGRCLGRPQRVAGEPMCFKLDRAEDIATFPSATIHLKGSGGGPTMRLRIAPEHLFVNMGWDQGAHCLAVYDNGARGAVIGANAMMGNDVIFDLAGEGDSGPRAGFAPSTCSIPVVAATPSSTASPSGTPSLSQSLTPTPLAGSAAPTSEAGAATSNEPSATETASALPSSVPTALASTASPSVDAAHEGKGKEVGAGSGSTYVSGSNQAIIAGGAATSILAACLLTYMCGNCECGCGRLSFRLGKGSGKGAYAPVDEAQSPGEEEDEEENEEDWGDGGAAATDRPQAAMRSASTVRKATAGSAPARPAGKASGKAAGKGKGPAPLTAIRVDAHAGGGRPAATSITTL